LNLNRLLATAAALVVTTAAGGSDNAASVSSATAKQFIDSKIVPAIRGSDANLSVSPASCPDKLDFSGKRTPYCTIMVNGVPVEVDISYDPSANSISISPASFFELDHVERLEKTLLLNSYGVKADISCGAPRYRLLPVGTIFTCSVVGSSTVSALRIRAEADGQLFTFNPTGQSSPAWMTTALAQHDEGKPTIIDGSTLAKWIQQLLQEGVAATNEPQPLMQDRCPPTVDLSGANHAICIVTMEGQDIRREVFIDPVKGIDTRTLDVPVDLSMVQHAIQNDLNQKLERAGHAVDGVVSCKPGLLVVTPPATFSCSATAGGKAYKVEVNVIDTKGTANWRFDSADTSPSPESTSPPGR
jgi:hypothetical protein